MRSLLLPKVAGPGYTALYQLEINLSARFCFPCFKVHTTLLATAFSSSTALQINIDFWWRNACGGGNLVPKLKCAREHTWGVLPDPPVAGLCVSVMGVATGLLCKPTQLLEE